MDKKLILTLGASAVALVLSASNASAMTCSPAVTSTPTPDLTTCSPGASDYVVSEFTFQRSANVDVSQDTVSAITVAGTTYTAGAVAAVGASNTKKGNRSYGGTVGGVSNPPKACQSNGTTPIATAPAATSVGTCTF